MSARAIHDPDERTLLTYATLVGLTPLIPLPFVDDLAKGYLQRRMVRALAEHHHAKIWDDEVKQLADDAPGGSIVKGLAKALIVAPLKKILKKTFMVLAGKSIVDLASRTYHHGFLVDRALARGWCAPVGAKSAAEVRRAIDEVLRETPVATSPITRALRIGYERSEAALVGLYTRLRGRFGRNGGSDEAVREAIADDSGEMGSVVEQLRHALRDVPRDHFDEIERRLARKIGPIELAGEVVGPRTE